jgi:hypothetical protein
MFRSAQDTLHFTVKLPQNILDEVVTVAKRRQVQKRGRNQKNQKIDSRKDLIVEIEGLMGEYAASLIYDVPVNKDYEADKGWDLVIYGYKVDIKATRHLYGVLLFTSLKHFKADVGMLAVITSKDTVKLSGWTTKMEFEAFSEYHPVKIGWKGYGLKQSQLYRMPSFIPGCLE